MIEYEKITRQINEVKCARTIEFEILNQDYGHSLQFDKK